MSSTSGELDSRLNAYRPDLAARDLEGRVSAARFVDGTRAKCVVGATPVLRRPDAASPQDTQWLFGETATCFEIADGWAWIQMDRDRYVGYVRADALTQNGAMLDHRPTHRVRVPATFAFQGDDIKSPVHQSLPLNALVTVAADAAPGKLAEIVAGAFVIRDHISPIEQVAEDPVAMALRFLETPYLWGGTTRAGIDCSGLVQMAYLACGIACPRDSDMQSAGFGTPVEFGGDPLAIVRRGDLLFWTGHVAICCGDGEMVHANGYHMSTVVEPIAPALKRIAGQGHELNAVRRPPSPA